MEKRKGQKPKVSIIMPSLNVAPYIWQCMDSVVNQTLREIEIICVDAGSTDGTAEILESYAERDDRITLIHSPVKSYGHQMNLGIERAKGTYIGIIETDDFASPDMFETLHRAAENYAVEVVKSSYFRYSGVQGASEDIVYPYMEFPYNRAFNPEKYPRILMPEPAIWSGLYQRKLLLENEIDFLETPGAAYQDTSFILKVWFCATRVLILKEAFLHYRIDNGASSVNSTGNAFDICKEFQNAQNYLDQRPEKKRCFQAYLLARKEYGYYWNYMRLGDSLKPSFFHRYQSEFSGVQQAEKSSLKAFSHKARLRLACMRESSDDCSFAALENQGRPCPAAFIADHSLRYLFRKSACCLNRYIRSKRKQEC